MDLLQRARQGIKPLGQSFFKILISKGANQAAPSLCVPVYEGGKAHSVKGIGLYHGVEGHIFKDHQIPLSKRAVKGIVSDHIPGQTGAVSYTHLDVYKRQMQEQQNLEQEIQAAVAADPPQEAEIRRSYEAKLAEAAERIKTCEQEKEQADNALEAYLAQKDAKNEEDRGAMEESLRAAYEEKKKAYETALQNRKDSLENASRNVEDANAPTKEDSSGAVSYTHLDVYKRQSFLMRRGWKE